MNEFLKFAGTVLFDKRAQRLATVDETKLPVNLRQKLNSYSQSLMLILGGIGLLLIHASLWTLGVTCVAVIIGLRLRSKIGDDLESRLRPYLEDHKNT